MCVFSTIVFFETSLLDVRNQNEKCFNQLYGFGSNIPGRVCLPSNSKNRLASVGDGLVFCFIYFSIIREISLEESVAYIFIYLNTSTWSIIRNKLNVASNKEGLFCNSKKVTDELWKRYLYTSLELLIFIQMPCNKSGLLNLIAILINASCE